MKSVLNHVLVIALGFSAVQPALASEQQIAVKATADQKAQELQTIVDEIVGIENQISSARSTRDVVVAITATVGVASALGVGLGAVAGLMGMPGPNKLLTNSLVVAGVSGLTGGVTIYIENGKIDAFLAQLENARQRHTAAINELRSVGRDL